MIAKTTGIRIACVAMISATPAAFGQISALTQDRSLFVRSLGEGFGPEDVDSDTSIASDLGPFMDSIAVSSSGGLSGSNAAATQSSTFGSQSIDANGTISGGGRWFGLSAHWQHSARSIFTVGFSITEAGAYAFVGDVSSSFQNLDGNFGPTTSTHITSMVELRDQSDNIVVSLLTSLDTQDVTRDVVSAQDSLSSTLQLTPGTYTLHASSIFLEDMTGSDRDASASYSVSLTTIPAPGAASIFALAFFTTARRRRTA